MHVVPARVDGAWATVSTLVRVPADSWQRGAVVQVQRAANCRFRVLDPSGSALEAFPLALRRPQDDQRSPGQLFIGQTDERGEWYPFGERPTPAGRFELQDCAGGVLWTGDAVADDRVITVTSSNEPLLVRLVSSGGAPLQTPNVTLNIVADPGAESTAIWKASFEDSPTLMIYYPRKNSLVLEATERWIRTSRIPIKDFLGRDELEIRTSADAASAAIAVRYPDGSPADGRLIFVRADPVRDAIYIVPVAAGATRIDGMAPGEYEVSAQTTTGAPLTLHSPRTVTLLGGSSVELKVSVARPRGF